MTSSVIVAGARTPMGRLLGSLKDFSAAELGAVAIKGALERSGVTGDQVDYVIMGQVLQAGAGQLPVRKASADAGIPMTVPSILINKVCLSGLDAIALADQLIRAGEVEIVVAGGMESMTNAPHVLPKSREGIKYGNTQLVDAMAFDGLTDAFDGQPMGSSTEGYNERYSPDPRGAGRLRGTLAPAGGGGAEERAVRRGDRARSRSRSDVVTRSSSPRTRASAPTRPSSRWAGCVRRSRKDGTITAGSASQISDGAAAVVVMSKAKAEQLGLTWLAEIGAHGIVAGPDTSLHEQPSNAIKKALDREGLSVDDLDVVEINEAFAAVGIVSARVLGAAGRQGEPQRRRHRARVTRSA